MERRPQALGHVLALAAEERGHARVQRGRQVRRARENGPRKGQQQLVELRGVLLVARVQPQEGHKKARVHRGAPRAEQRGKQALQRAHLGGGARGGGGRHRARRAAAASPAAAAAAAAAAPAAAATPLLCNRRLGVRPPPKHGGAQRKAREHGLHLRVEVARGGQVHEPHGRRARARARPQHHRGAQRGQQARPLAPHALLPAALAQPKHAAGAARAIGQARRARRLVRALFAGRRAKAVRVRRCPASRRFQCRENHRFQAVCNRRSRRRVHNLFSATFACAAVARLGGGFDPRYYEGQGGKLRVGRETVGSSSRGQSHPPC